MEFQNKEAFIMQNTRNFNHLYIARFEASLKYVNTKIPSYKSIITHIFNACKCLKVEKKPETPYLRKIYKYIHIFKEKSNFLVVFTPIFSCFRRPSSLLLTRVFH